MAGSMLTSQSLVRPTVAGQSLKDLHIDLANHAITMNAIENCIGGTSDASERVGT